MDLGQMLATSTSRAPEKTAIIFRDQRTSFAELNRRVNQVANALIGLGIRPGDRVALYMHNIPLFVEAYYGILKAGAAYVPIEPTVPAARMQFVVHDSAPVAAVTNAALNTRLDGLDLPTIDIGAIGDSAADEQPGVARSAAARVLEYLRGQFVILRKPSNSPGPKLTD